MWKHRSIASAALALLVTTSMVIPDAAAQPRRRGRANVRSVTVSDDHNVTFRIRAPKADEVSVAGDFGSSKMEKNDEGVWSAAVGPLRPDYYSYHFNVDGVRTPDARNPLIKPGLGGIESLFLVPGDEAQFEMLQDVPHGEVRIAWYHSKTLGQQRSVRVYTPPGYDPSSDHYPVFYLLHGAGDDDQGWSTIGRAGFILDNLIADQKAVPMIVVMPNGSMPRPRPTGDADNDRAARMASWNRFNGELLDDIVPFVESRYRVEKGPEHRALAGLSMGGAQTLRVFTSHPDAFAYVGMWSGGLFGRNTERFEEQNEAFLKDAETVNKHVKLLSISVGKDDSLAFEGAKALDGILKEHGITHELHVSDGGHTWINWRHYLNAFAPKLFH